MNLIVPETREHATFQSCEVDLPLMTATIELICELLGWIANRCALGLLQQAASLTWARQLLEMVRELMKVALLPPKIYAA